MLNESQLPPKNDRYFSTGYLCQMLSILPAQLLVLCEATGIEQFDMTQDQTAYLRGDNVQKILDKHAEVVDEINSVSEATRWN